MGELKRCPIQILWLKSHKYARKYWLLIHFQANSFYGLLDVESIQSPMFNGKHLQLPYFPGHCYAAVKTKDSSQVIFVSFFNALRFWISKDPTMILQKEKPQNLIYHIHSFHVLDLKVFQIISFQTYTLFCRYASALTFHLELSMKSCLVASISILFTVMAHCMETLYLLMINLLKLKLFS